MGNHRMDRFGTEGVLGLLIRETEAEREATQAMVSLLFLIRLNLRAERHARGS